MAYTLQHQTPSTGYISWSDVHIVFDGVDHAIANGNTNLKYVYWLKNSPTSLQTSDTYPTLGADDAMVFINRYGVATSVLDSTLVDGSLVVPGTITAEAISAGAISAGHIASNAITADKIQTGAITADKVAANAITASKLAVSSFGATVNTDPAFTDASCWTVTMGGVLPTFTTVSDGIVGNNVVRSTAGVMSWINEAKKIPIDKNKTYRVRCYVRTKSGSGSTMYMGVALFDAAGTNITGTGSQWYYAANGVQPPSSWTEYSGTFGLNTSKTFPSNAAYMVPLLVMSYNGGTSVHEAQDLRIEEVLGSTLIQDGAISTNKLAANAVTADKILAGSIGATQIAAGAITATKIAAGTITANEIAASAITSEKIAAGAVGADQIAANAITAKQLAIGDFENLAINGNFALVDSSWNLSTDVSIVADAANAYLNLQYVAKLSPSATTTWAINTNTFSCKEGDKFYLEWFGKAATALTGSVLVQVRWEDSAGNQVGLSGVGSLTTQTAYTQFAGEVVAPTGAVRGFARMQASNTAGIAYIGTINLRRKSGGVLIEDGAITASKIAVGTITAAQIATDTITASNIAAGAIGASEIAAGAVTAGKIAAGAVTATEIAAGAISADKIAANTITGDKLAIGSSKFDRVRLVGSGSNVSDGITAGQVYINGVLAKSSTSRGLTVYVYNRSTHEFISQTSYDTYGSAAARDQLATDLNALTSSVIVFITSYDAINMSSTSDMLRTALKRCGASAAIDNTSITYRHPYALIGYPGIGEGNGIECLHTSATTDIKAEVSTFWIDSEIQGVGSSISSMTQLKSTYIADGAITTAKITAGAVTANEIASNTITAAKIAAGTITGTEIAAGTISATNIAASTITGSKIAASTITGSNIAANTITATQIAAGTITATQIASGTITSSNIAAGTITASNIASNTITASKLTIGDTSNIYPDPDMLDDSLYIGFDSIYYTAAYGAGRRIANIAASTSAKTAYTAWFSVSPGQNYFVEALIANVDTVSTMGTFSAYIEWASMDSSGNKTVVATTTIATNSSNSGTNDSNRLSVYYTTGPTIRSARFKIVRNAGGDSNVTFGLPVVRLRANGELIVDGAITAAKIAAGTITANEISSGAITTAKLAAGAVTATTIASGTITGDKIASNTITAKNIVVGDYSNIALDPNGDNGDPLFSGCSVVNVTEGKAYQCPDSTRDSFSSTYFAVDAGDQYYLQADMQWVSGGTVASTLGFHIIDAAGATVGWYGGCTTSDTSTGWKTVGGSLTIPSNGVKARLWWQRNGTGSECGVWKMRMVSIRRKAQGNLIVDGAITTSKIAAGAVTATTIAANTITGDKIAAGTITASNIASNTITASQIAASTITGSKIAAGTITADKIAAGSITGDKIAAGTITADRLAAGSITGDKIAANQVLSSPTLDMGSVYINSGAAGFGLGGPYGGWGRQWHTIIYADGGLYTSKINASGGTFSNVTISETCDVRGTIYANKIVGDVIAIKPMNLGFYTGGAPYKIYKNQEVAAFSFNLSASNVARYIKINGSSCSGSNVYMKLYIGGNLVSSRPNEADGMYVVPAKSGVTVVQFNVWYVNNGADYTYTTASLVGEVIVYPVSSGTFV